MRRLLHPFVLIVSVTLVLAFVYVALRVTSTTVERCALAVPFILVWIVPIRYWVDDRESTGVFDDLVHIVGYLSMGWLNFLFALVLGRDVLLFASSLIGAARLFAFLDGIGGASFVFGGACLALGGGIYAAFRGPHVKRVDIAIEGLDPGLDGLKIVQISDLHAGPTIRRHYVRRVVDMTNELNPDLVAITGDVVDGTVGRLSSVVAPLADLRPRGQAFLVLGNHEYYSGALPWIGAFERLGLKVLRNEFATVSVGEGKLLVGGVVDPAAATHEPRDTPRMELARGPVDPEGAARAFRLLLAHNPKLAPLAAAAGFDLQLSGHTHAGQFFPWNLAVHLIHSPHVAGLSREGRMWVYVSAGTGTWGPPIRFGTKPELTLLRLVRPAG